MLKYIELVCNQKQEIEMRVYRNWHKHKKIRKLTRQAYPSASSSLLDVLALDHFVDALTDPDMRFRIRESRPKSIF